MAQLGIALDGDYIAPDRARRTAELLAKQRDQRRIEADVITL
jgi:hypothetical protein